MKLRLVSRNEIRAFVSKALETLREEIANHKASTIFVIVITFLLAQLYVEVWAESQRVLEEKKKFFSLEKLLSLKGGLERDMARWSNKAGEEKAGEIIENLRSAEPEFLEFLLELAEWGPLAQKIRLLEERLAERRKGDKKATLSFLQWKFEFVTSPYKSEVKVFCDKEMGGLQRLDEKFGKVNREGTAENKLLAKITKMEETAKEWENVKEAIKSGDAWSPEEKTELERLISGLKKQIETDRAVSHQVDAVVEVYQHWARRKEKCAEEDYMKKPGNDFVDLKIPYYIFKQFHENEDGYFWQNEFIGLDKDAADHKKKEFIEIVNKEFERFIKEMKKPGPEELKKIEEKGKNPEES